MDSKVTQRFFQSLLLLPAQAAYKQLAEHLQFPKAENRILRSKLPARINSTEGEKENLLKLGKPAGKAIKNLITIVTPHTFARWLSQEGKAKKPAGAKGNSGPPRKSNGFREMELKFARERTG